MFRPAARRRWLLESRRGPVFTPERLTEEHRLIAQTTTDFVDNEVLPVLDRLEQKDWTLARQLVRRCGELGLLGVDVAEAYGGVGLDKVTSMIVSEGMAQSASFGATFRRASEPDDAAAVALRHRGAETQYLPKLLSGELVGAYCLSESGSGSDALGAKARAVAAGRRQLRPERREDVDHQWRLRRPLHRLRQGRRRAGDHFTAFIVERAFGGVTSGKEEHKMGLHGSSTTPVILQDVRVPAENLLGEIGKGHKIAFNVLNFGALQARRDVQRRRAGRDRRGGALRRRAQAVRTADRVVRRHQDTSSAR